MQKTDYEKRFERLARKAAPESFAVSATIDTRLAECLIELQLLNDDEDAVKVMLSLPIAEESAVQEIRRAVNIRTGR